jgi:hypothetical protein
MSAIPTYEQLSLGRRRWLITRCANLGQEISAIRTLCIVIAAEECAKAKPDHKQLTALAEIEETLRKVQTVVNHHVFLV